MVEAPSLRGQQRDRRRPLFQSAAGSVFQKGFYRADTVRDYRLAGRRFREPALPGNCDAGRPMWVASRWHWLSRLRGLHKIRGAAQVPAEAFDAVAPRFLLYADGSRFDWLATRLAHPCWRLNTEGSEVRAAAEQTVTAASCAFCIFLVLTDRNDRLSCVSVNSSRSLWCTKAELSNLADSETPRSLLFSFSGR